MNATVGKWRRYYSENNNPDKADAASSVSAHAKSWLHGVVRRWVVFFLKQNMVVVHEISQGDGFKNPIQGRLQAFPCLAYFASVKAGAVAGFFQAAAQFDATFHEVYDAAKGQIFGLP